MSERPAGRAATVRLAGEIGGGLFIGGAIIGAVAIQLPHPPEVDTAGFLWLFLGELIFGVLLLGWSRLGGSSRWLAPLTIAGAIVVITVSVSLSGERDGGPALMSELFYVWPALYAGYFFRWWVAGVVVAAIAVAYCATEVAIGMEASTVVAPRPGHHLRRGGRRRRGPRPAALRRCAGRAARPAGPDRHPHRPDQPPGIRRAPRRGAAPSPADG